MARHPRGRSPARWDQLTSLWRDRWPPVGRTADRPDWGHFRKYPTRGGRSARARRTRQTLSRDHHCLGAGVKRRYSPPCRMPRHPQLRGWLRCCRCYCCRSAGRTAAAWWVGGSSEALGEGCCRWRQSRCDCCGGPKRCSVERIVYRVKKLD